MSKNIVFVNAVKKGRADEIVALVSGALIPKTPELVELKNKFVVIFEQDGVDVKDTEEATAFVYEKLGGLISTVEVETKKKAKANVSKKKAKDDDDE